ncbi:MAG: phosphoribosylformylglycinamidine synthase subunit PurS [Candidatus Hatepunaea meridiana]|nr:phosphoribosylformylglycinamidine synthase subunit PurS [Candidatus Hatepunaea meridiana]
MKARVYIRLKPAILDPQGKAVLHSLQQLGYDEVKSVRIGKLIELEIDNSDPDVMKRIQELSHKILTNPLMETFDIKIDEDDAA